MRTTSPLALLFAALLATATPTTASAQDADALARANSIPSWQTPEDYRRGLAADKKMYAELLPAIGIRGG